MIEDGQWKGTTATPQSTLKQNTIVSEENNGTQRLAEIGITRKQSSTYQAIASIPDEDLTSDMVIINFHSQLNYFQN
ncbi:MAG: hypothetical protein EOP48_06405 [Sphingobacteriales bacterium]|nr:MAG: hypothetical protein EOP48_06405 [Sphingobacteriales bacterium]